MIKRRFYKMDHGDRDVASNSSSSSDSEVEADYKEETEDEEEDDPVAEVRRMDETCSSSSGYESEDSSANEVNLDSSGLQTNEDGIGDGSEEQDATESHPSVVSKTEMVNRQSNTVAKDDTMPSDVASCVLKCKSVFKCKLCPRIVCLTEETLKAHLKSKRHARSEKLLKEGRLKVMLNSDGEIEEESHLEKPVQTVDSAQDSSKSRKKNKGRQRQRKRKMKKMEAQSKVQSTKNPTKKRHKGNN